MQLQYTQHICVTHIKTKNMRTLKIKNLENSGEIAEVQAIYSSKVKVSERVRIDRSLLSYKYLIPVYSDIMEYREQSVLLLLNRNNEALGWVSLSQGGTSGTIIDPKVVFQIALQTNASALILSHNHPSGSLKPSPEDIRITDNIIEAGKFLDIAVVDHIILTKYGYFSFADDGLINQYKENLKVKPKI